MIDVGAAGAKPLDLGSGSFCASFDLRSAAWLSVGGPHPAHGFVELSALPAFDEARRGDPASTRLYRLAMTRPEHAFLRVELDGDPPDLTPDTSDPASPRWTADLVEVRASAEPDARAIRQAWSVDARSGARPSFRIRLRGTLDRPALAEITELDPPQPTGAITSFTASDAAVTIAAPALPAEAVVTVHGAHVTWTSEERGVMGSVAWRDGAPHLDVILEVSLSGLARSADPAIALGSADADPIVARALTYIRGCTALAVRDDERTMLTDHRILPLSWTRDAYWQALALLAADEPGDRERVADHLRWLWRRCERPDGRWVRSHHADGRRKDLAFQADQQLYPMVELADYWRLTGELPAGVAWEQAVARAWEAAVRAINPATGLIASTENAADDPAAAPFIAASQVLLWYAAERIAELADAGALRLDSQGVRRAGTTARAAFAARLAGSAGPWPYAVDAEGRRVAYHDANDLPVALAPLWGFCDRDDPGWSATMEFAFGEGNPAWFGGARPGLGSTHTPGPWTLGDIQAWVRARTVGDRPAMEKSLARLHEVAFVDGMLPEAYAADPTDDRRIRHWFAWPGAALGALVLLDRHGRLEERLSAQHTG